MNTETRLSKCHEYDGPEWVPEMDSPAYTRMRQEGYKAMNERPGKVSGGPVEGIEHMTYEAQRHIIRCATSRRRIHWADAENCMISRGVIAPERGVRFLIVGGYVFNQAVREEPVYKVCKKCRDEFMAG